MASFLAGLSSPPPPPDAAAALPEDPDDGPDFLDGSLDTSAAEAAAAAAAAADRAAWEAPADLEPPPLFAPPFLPGAAMGTQTSLAFSSISWMVFLDVGWIMEKQNVILSIEKTEIFH